MFVFPLLKILFIQNLLVNNFRPDSNLKISNKDFSL